MRLGLIRETKDPPDRRVPLSPAQCRRLLDTHDDLEIRVQPSPIRCYGDGEYAAAGLTLREDLGDCDVLLGVKEVRLDALIPHKTYLFFSHTAKEQPYNRPLLQEVIRRRIRLIDYEYLTDDGVRVVAFGRWAGIVGAYNALRGLGRVSGGYRLRPAHECFDLAEVRRELGRVTPGRTRIAVTGGGRVAGGALEILHAANIRETEPADYLDRDFGEAVFTRLDPWHYTRRSDDSAFDFEHFVQHPDQYENALPPYAARSDALIACHYWDPRAPQMLTRDDLRARDLPLRLVADISCDIGEPIASTIRPSTIAAPFYGYDPVTGGETAPFEPGVITVMAVDNLPGELPRDASEDFGEALIEHVLPELLGLSDRGMLARATITDAGTLAPPYAYLEDYLHGR